MMVVKCSMVTVCHDILCTELIIVVDRHVTITERTFVAITIVFRV